MLDKDIVILRVMEDAHFTAAGKNEPRIRVEFKVGDHGPFTERFEKATYTALVRDAALTKFAKEVRSS